MTRILHATHSCACTMATHFKFMKLILLLIEKGIHYNNNNCSIKKKTRTNLNKKKNALRIFELHEFENNNIK